MTQTKTLKITALIGLTALGLAGAQGTAPAAQPAATPSQAAAVKTSPIKVTNVMQRVTTVTENGKPVEKFSDVKGVVPGEILQFTYKYQNITKLTVQGNNLNTAVPRATTFLSQQCDATGTKTLFTIDKQVLDKNNDVTNVNTMKFAAAPLKKTVTVKENGVDVKKEVTVDPSEYTAVRWALPDIKAGQTFTCTMRVKVK